MTKSSNELVVTRSILILGISGGLAQLLAKKLLNQYPQAHILGVDARRVDDVFEHPRLQVRKFKYTRAQFEQLFLSDTFDTVFHLARMGHGRIADSLEKRLRINVLGTGHILNLCKKAKVKNLVIMSTFHVYGAVADNPAFLDEESPLRASIEYPELRDVVDMDQICQTWMWENQKTTRTVILRPTNIIGPSINNSITQFFSSPIALKPIDYNPTFQFIHEKDMAAVLVKSLEFPIGVYNVVKDDDYLPLRDVFKIHRPFSIPFPLSLTKLLKGRLSPAPEYLLNYLKFSCLVSGKKLAKELPENFFQFSSEEAVEQLALK